MLNSDGKKGENEEAVSAKYAFLELARTVTDRITY